MIYSTHVVYILIGEYLGFSRSNLSIFGSTQCCPACLYHDVVYINKLANIVIEVFNLV